LWWRVHHHPTTTAANAATTDSHQNVTKLLAAAASEAATCSCPRTDDTASAGALSSTKDRFISSDIAGMPDLVGAAEDTGDSLLKGVSDWEGISEYDVGVSVEDGAAMGRASQVVGPQGELLPGIVGTAPPGVGREDSVGPIVLVEKEEGEGVGPDAGVLVGSTKRSGSPFGAEVPPVAPPAGEGVGGAIGEQLQDGGTRSFQDLAEVGISKSAQPKKLHSPAIKHLFSYGHIQRWIHSERRVSSANIADVGEGG